MPKCEIFHLFDFNDFSKDFICDWKSYRVRQGKRSCVKCVDVGSFSLIKIPVVIGIKSAKLGQKMPEMCVGKKSAKSGF